MIEDKSKELLVVEYKNDETKMYSDFFQIKTDLYTSLDAINRSLKHCRSEDISSWDNVLLLHLFSSALNKYYRCFSSGSRKNLTHNIFCDAEEKKVHEYYINYRSKYIAHSYNKFEDCNTGLILSDMNPETATIIGIAVFNGSLLLPGGEKDFENQLNWIKRVVVKALEYVDVEIEVLRNKIIDNAKKENIEKLCLSPRLSFTAPNLAKVKQGKVCSNKA